MTSRDVIATRDVIAVNIIHFKNIRLLQRYNGDTTVTCAMHSIRIQLPPPIFNYTQRNLFCVGDLVGLQFLQWWQTMLKTAWSGDVTFNFPYTLAWGFTAHAHKTGSWYPIFTANVLIHLIPVLVVFAKFGADKANRFKVIQLLVKFVISSAAILDFEK